MTEDDQVRLKSLNIVGGAVHMELLPPESFAAVFIETARASLEGAENYMEYEIRDGKTGERFAVVVQRVGKLTPHAARVDAEAKAASARSDTLREAIAKVSDPAARRAASSAGYGEGWQSARGVLATMLTDTEEPSDV